MSSAGGGAAAPPSWKTTHTEFVAVILACTTMESSSRLDPLIPTRQSDTAGNSSQDDAEQDPPHNAGLLWWLQVAGISLLDRLLGTSATVCGFTQIVLVLETHDHVTRSALLVSSHKTFVWQVQSGSCDDLSQPLVLLLFQPPDASQSAAVQITVWNKKPTTRSTTTTIDALRQIEEAQLVPADSHVVILPGDLVVFNAEPIKAWIHQHRLRQKSVVAPAAAASVLLVDVGAVDEQTGHPLKESAKQKKGLLAREDEEEIDYTALTFPAPHRLIWKQCKLDVEQDKDMVGSTPKLVLPRQRLVLQNSSKSTSPMPTTTRVSTDLNDVHCYILAPWVRRLIVHRAAMRSIQHDLIPLLVARQFRGLRATFGSAVDKDVMEEVMQQQLQQQQPLWSRNGSLFHSNNNDDNNHTGSLSLPFTPRGTNATFPNNNSNPTDPPMIADEYAVLAHVVTDKSIFRAHTLTSYLYANREMAHQVSASVHLAATATTTDDDEEHHHSLVSNNPCLKLPEASTIKSKFHTVLLRDTTIGEKVTFKQCIVGRHTRLGAKCRLHNVVLGDYVTVGDNVLLQNTAVASHAVIGDQCSLNDCVVGMGATVPAGTKGKGESWSARAPPSSGELL